MTISVETIRLKLRNKLLIPLTYRSRRKKLKFDDFTIISNNCWGGTVYESYGLRKMSPTVGMFIMPEDYLKFVASLDHYLSQPISFIEPDESKWASQLEGKSNWKTYPIARLDDIELHMLHYHDKALAQKKWQSRVDRVNKDRLIVKFNDQNGCTAEQIKAFAELPIEHKLCFVASPEMKVSDEVILIDQPKKYKDGVKASREPFGRTRYIDLTAYINGLDKSELRGEG